MIEVGILKNFNSDTYRAGVQLAGSLTTYFDNINVAKNIPAAAMVIGNYVILAIPGANPKDACVIATWPGGAGSFLDLSDTPSIYSGHAFKVPRVNAAETALEFTTPSRWQLVDDHIFTANATTYTINGLNGDADIQYLISLFNVCGVATGGAAVLLRPNNDNGFNYPRQYIYAQGTSVVAGSDTICDGFSVVYASALGQLALCPLMTLHAVSGRQRVMFGFRHSIARWLSFIAEWANTTDNITSLVFYANVANVIGAGSRYTLWKRVA